MIIGTLTILQVGPGQGPPHNRPSAWPAAAAAADWQQGSPRAAGGGRPKGPGHRSEWRAREDDRCRLDCRRGILDLDNVHDFGGPGGPGRRPSLRSRARWHWHPVTQWLTQAATGS